MGAVSDLAAMGARPIGALVALCVPESAGEGDLSLGVTEGVAEASRASGCVVVGGDLSAGGVLTVVVTVLGTLDGGAAVERSGGRPGDVLFVSGPCGGSAAGLRVLRAAGAAGQMGPRGRRGREGRARTGGVGAGRGLSPARGPSGRRGGGPAGGGARHDRRLGRVGARPAPAGGRLRGRVRSCTPSPWPRAPRSRRRWAGERTTSSLWRSIHGMWRAMPPAAPRPGSGNRWRSGSCWPMQPSGVSGTRSSSALVGSTPWAERPSDRPRRARLTVSRAYEYANGTD